jgi:hypothetical protein
MPPHVLDAWPFLHPWLVNWLEHGLGGGSKGTVVLVVEPPVPVAPPLALPPLVVAPPVLALPALAVVPPALPALAVVPPVLPPPLAAVPPAFVAPPGEVEPPAAVEPALAVEPLVAVPPVLLEPPFPAADDELAEPEEPPFPEEPPVCVVPPVGLVVAGLVDPPLLGPDVVVLAQPPTANINPHRPAANESRGTVLAMLVNCAGRKVEVETIRIE